MNIHKTIALVAGGPGSGRHATGQVLKKHGWRNTDMYPGSQDHDNFSHSKFPNDSVKVKDNGNWQHKMGRMKPQITTGDNAESLDKHLSHQYGTGK